jgi:hypothetical protein
MAHKGIEGAPKMKPYWDRSAVASAANGYQPLHGIATLAVVLQIEPVCYLNPESAYRMPNLQLFSFGKFSL